MSMFFRSVVIYVVTTQLPALEKNPCQVKNLTRNEEFLD